MGMYSITPIGSASATASAVAGAYVEYLENGQPMRGLAKQNNLDGTVSYYADAIEGPGMWSGHGAARLGLVGEVDPEDLKSLLEGRHHVTGERLTTARGSAGRYGLKVGEPTRLVGSRPVWSRHDLQHRFDLDDETFDELLATFSIEPTEHESELFYEVGAVAQLAAVLDAGDQEVDLHAGGDDDLLSTGQAAKLLGVSRQYVGKVIAQHHTLIDAGADLDEADVDWLPATREGRLGKWKIRRGDLIDFHERRKPPAVRLAYDVTFTFEKSVSILGLLSEGPVRDIVTQAVIDANAAGLAHFDQNASHGRARGGTIGSEGLAVASYLHATSRNDDPFLHGHNVVANVIEDANGDGRALDGRNLYLEAPTAAALASAELRWQLNQQLGVAFVANDNGVEIAGISKDLRDVFSSRSAEVEDLVGKISATAAERARAAQLTRPAKGDQTIEELFDGWWKTAQGHGFTPADLADVQHTVEPFSKTLSDAERIDLLAHLGGRDGVTAQRSVFTYGDVVRAIGDWSPDTAGVRVMPAAMTRQLADDFVTSIQVVPLDVDKRRVEPTAGKITSTIEHTDLFSTRRMLRIHNQIDERWAAGLNSGGAVATASATNGAFESHPTLTSAQRDFVTQWVSSGHQFQSGIGVPGAGKTFAMAAAQHAWENSGYRVVGAAIKGTAARELAAVGLESQTLKSLFDQHDMGALPLDARTVLIVDEASTIGDEDLHRVLGIARESGTTVRFLGDTEQHQSVPAGGMWSHLVNAYGANTPMLTDSQRFRDSPVDIEANEALREGRISDAFAILAAAGQLHETDTRRDAYEALLRRAVDTRAAGNAAPMIERTNEGRQILNDAMQQIRIDAGEVVDVQTFERHRFGVGDEVIARSKRKRLHPGGDPQAYIRNGSTGTVIAADNERLTVEFDGLGTIEIQNGQVDVRSRNGADLLQLGYALTSYSVQGSTHPLSNSAAAPGATRPELVVDLSRGQTDNQFILVGNNDDHMQAFREPTNQSLTDRVAESVSVDGTLLADELDPTALDRDMNLARIHAMGEEHHDHLVAVEKAQRRALIAAPPVDISNYLPEKPSVPHLRQQWENAVVDAGMYAARYTPRPNKNAAWGYTLGAEPDPAVDPKRHEAWSAAVSGLATAATAVTLRKLNDHALSPLVPVETPLVELQRSKPKRRDLRAVRAAFNKLERVTHSHLVEVHHDERRARTETAREALGYRRQKFQRHDDLNGAVHTALSANPPDIGAAVDAIELQVEQLDRDLRRAHDRRFNLDNQKRRPHPIARQRSNHEIASHQQQLDLAESLRDKLQNINVTQPNPLEVQRQETISHRARTQPDSWLTGHIEDLAKANKITPSSNPVLFGQWAGQAAIYRERWNADPLATSPPSDPDQRDDHRALSELHKTALDPGGADLNLTDLQREAVSL